MLTRYRRHLQKCRHREKVRHTRGARAQNEVEPYTGEKAVKSLAACDEIGRTSYEQLRARAIILLLQYTALRIGDVPTLEKARVGSGELHVRTPKAANR